MSRVAVDSDGAGMVRPQSKIRYSAVRHHTSISSKPRVHAILSVRRTVDIEAKGLNALSRSLDGPLASAFLAVLTRIQSCWGRTILTGIGKSGYIARKIAAAFASTGTLGLYVHPSEASHGDLGMITTDDVALMLSNSGETVELKDMLAYSRRFSIPLICDRRLR